MRQQAGLVAPGDFPQRSAIGEPAIQHPHVRHARVHRLNPVQRQPCACGLGRHGGQPVGAPRQVDQVDMHIVFISIFARFAPFLILFCAAARFYMVEGSGDALGRIWDS